MVAPEDLTQQEADWLNAAAAAHDRSLNGLEGFEIERDQPARVHRVTLIFGPQERLVAEVRDDDVRYSPNAVAYPVAPPDVDGPTVTRDVDSR